MSSSQRSTSSSINPSSDGVDPPFSNKQFFISNGRQWYCTICRTEWLGEQKAIRHEDSALHVQTVRQLDELPPSESDSQVVTPMAEPHPQYSFEAKLPAAFSSPHLPSPTEHLATDTSPRPCPGNANRPAESRFTVHGPRLDTDPPDQLFDDYGGGLGPYKEHLPTDEELGMSSDLDIDFSTGYSEGDLGEGPLDLLDLSDSESELSSDEGGVADDDDISVSNDEDWWPWRNEKECLTDLLSAFPRAVFSEPEIEVTRWFATKLGVTKLPTARSVKRRRKKILALAGSGPRLVPGSLGNWYSVASIGKIIADEMANPEVRPHLRFLPEESPRHSDAFHGERWRCEVDGNTSSPMVRVGKHDYFVEEPALADIQVGPCGSCATPVWPTRWFLREGVIHAKAHILRADAEHRGFIISQQCIDIPLDAFFLSFPQLREVQQHYGLSHIDCILGIETEDGLKDVSSQLPNPWRIKAAGARVLSLPTWLYCDDTSGNVSKKWNKHNSFLFVLAGLVQKFALHPYNIHFLSTSNLAPPLEMLEQIAADIQEYFRDGLRVWDCELQEEVLLVLWVLAFLGDNPMQSEFASHIGLTGKCFCRVCHVRGKGKDRPATTQGEIDRVSEFMKIGTLRDRNYTWTKLQEQLRNIMDGVPTRVTTSQTDTGIKDRHFTPLYDELAAICSSVRDGNRAQGRELNYGLFDALRQKLGNRRAEDIFNPVFLFKDFNPHTETPVEILHVILLGIIKYFWRDAVARQNSVTKRILRLRISSLEVTELGLAALRGSTLVNYAGSLTGRDFRVVAQIAPAVLYDLLPEAAYEAWLALCRLTPLVFQPAIENLDAYLIELEGAIDNFLAATALWTTQWFNKPKFHILLHLPSGIRRFAPAILTATEGFESYNLVIRMRSVHSNRHAPSVDIARAMSFMHATRHLVSGGWVLNIKGELKERRQAGSGVLGLRNDTLFSKLMGMITQEPIGEAGSVYGAKKTKWSETELAIEHLLEPPDCVKNNKDEVDVCARLYLSNGDIAARHNFVLWTEHGTGAVLLAQMQEIIAFPDKSIIILIRPWTVGPSQMPYRLPGISPQTHLLYITAEDILCCIHTFHNCAAHKCQTSRTRAIIQERIDTGALEDEYVHGDHIDDRILNLAQLRSAIHIQTFQSPAEYPPLHPQDPEYNLVADAVKRYEQQREMAPPATRGRRGKQKATPTRASTRSQRPSAPRSQTPIQQPPPHGQATPLVAPHFMHPGYMSGPGPSMPIPIPTVAADFATLSNAGPSSNLHALPAAPMSPFQISYGQPMYPTTPVHARYSVAPPGQYFVDSPALPFASGVLPPAPFFQSHLPWFPETPTRPQGYEPRSPETPLPSRKRARHD